jgi:hypothetical protein
MNPRKISSSLAAALDKTPEDELTELVVELANKATGDVSGLTRQQKIRIRKTAFEKQVEPIVQEIERVGGEVTGQAWINGTLRARVPKKMIAALSDQAPIAKLDTPRGLQADVS